MNACKFGTEMASGLYEYECGELVRRCAKIVDHTAQSGMRMVFREQGFSMADLDIFVF